MAKRVLTNVPAGSYVGKVYLAGGGTHAPFYAAELRAALRKRDVKTDLPKNATDVAGTTVGMRALALGGAPVAVKVPDHVHQVHVPSLLRIHGGATPDTGILHIGAEKGDIDAPPERQYGDQLVCPLAPGWIEQNYDPGDEDNLKAIVVPTFRLLGGDTRVRLKIENKGVGKLLGIKDGRMFGLLQLAPPDPGHLDLGLVAEGIEFDGALPDPTRLDDAPAMIDGRFRLEHDDHGKEGRYYLRLVGGEKSALDALEARIGATFADLAQEPDAPLLVSMDLAPSVPPLLWPLELKSKVLRLVEAGASGDAVMEIDPAKVTVHLRSRSSYPGESVGLATVSADRIRWTREVAGFGLRIDAGTAGGSAIAVAFNKAPGGPWSSTLAAAVGKREVTVPLYEHADRMRDMYQRAGALPADMAQAPYLYLPLERGCLQLGMPPESTAAPGLPPASVMTGRLVAATQAGGGRALGRAVRIDDAAALTLDMAFSIEDKRFVASGASLTVYEVRAALRGFLFAFETSPTAIEGLPDLRKGPAATRELALHMGSNDTRLSLHGSFDWDAESDEWSLKVDPVVLLEKSHYAWLALARNPFITSHALTRSVAAATEPSVSRGLVPLSFKTGFTLHAKAGEVLPSLDGVTGSWEQMFADRADRLILPTLAGLEFLPDAADVKPRLTAALRWDHPLLDELFAWSDPPHTAEAPAALEVPVLARTSLDPQGMHEVWARNRHRLALTRTQGDFAVENVAAGAEHRADITTLVQPYHWNTTLKVDLDHPYGSYHLANIKYELDGAVAGLDGVAFASDDDGNLIAHGGSEGDVGRIEIGGSAASVFERDALRWDSRGLGLGPMDKGLRTAALKLEADTKAAPFGLKTLAGPVTYDIGDVRQTNADWMRFGGSLHFYARDLPVADGKFIGDANPLEGPFGLTGQAFLPEHLGYALHEWRFFGDALEVDGARGSAKLWEHDIAVGPFRFKPLRLREASWNEGTDRPALRIAGALWLALGEGKQGAEGPFGADHVYRNADLFELTLTPGAGAAWSHAWNGVKIARSDPDSPKFEAREPTLRCDLTLLDATGSGIPYADPVAATLEMDIGKRSAILHACLFGSDLQIPASGTSVEDDRIVLTFELPAPTAAARPTSVSLADISLTVTIDESGATLSTAGVLVVMPDAHSAADTQRALALFSGDAANWRWLALDAAACDLTAASPSLQINHATGALSGQWSGGGTRCTPLFGFAHEKFEASAFIRAYAAPLAPGGAASAIGMASAWMRVECRGKQAGSIAHVLLEDGVNRDHGLILDGVSSFASAIEWPLDGFLKDRAGGEALDLDADPWLDPGLGEPVLNPRVRHLAIAAEGRSASHSLTLRLQGQRIEAGQLAWTGSEVTVSSPLRMLAVGEHVLAQGKRSANWSALEYVTVTTATAMSAEPGDALYFAPRYQVGKFRGKDDDYRRIPWPAFVPLPLALAGLHDPGLRQFLWKDLIPKDPKQLAPPVFMGGTVLQMRVAGEQSMLAVMPWLRLDERQARLRQRGGWWRTAACELWAPHPLGAMESLRLFRVGADVSAPAMAAQFGGVGMAQAASGAGLVDQLPVEQAFFEKWNGSKGLALVKDDLASAPFFLRALLAIARRWHLDAPAGANEGAERAFRWDVATVHPGLLASGEPGAVRVEVHAAKQSVPAYEDPAALVPADLVVLSRSRANRLARYRMKPRSASMSGLNAALTSRALDVDRSALLAIEETNAPGPQAPLFALVPLGLNSVLPRRQRAALPPDRLAPSAALGWPSATGLAGLDRLGPTIGAELPVLSAQAGFAARLQRFGWPALAVRAGEASADFPAAPAAFYLSFANRVAFAHNTALTFEGPAARHLLPSPVRRRVPVASSLAGALPKAEMEGGPRLAEPMLLPAIERGTLGRRPGVMEVAVASLTVPGDPSAFDSGYIHFGAPGNSGPVAAQQLRTPRSPALPRDADDRLAASETGKQALDFRRRTYLSVHDLLESGELAPFTANGSAFDVLRVGDMPVRWKIGFAGQSSIGPDWNGRLGVAVGIAGSDKEGNEKLVADDARLEIGSLVLPLALDTPPMDGARFSWTCARLDAARAALREADADTPMRLVFGLRRADAPPAAGQLPEAPQTSCSLPLLLDPGNRAVLPVRLHTIAFGDPSYDRQLGSPTASTVLELNQQRLLLAADRKQYDSGALLYLAGGLVERASGLFDPADAATRLVRLTRLRPSAKPELPAVATALGLADVSPTQGRYPLRAGVPVQIALAQLRAQDDSGSVRALRAGDYLLLELEYEPGKDLQLVVEIVAEQVIAPAPSVFSVIASNAGEAWKTTVLHAAGPLPQRIEFPGLARDLAHGHVRRRALFVWRWAVTGDASREQEVLLVKFDRSGGAQLPEAPAIP